MSVTATLYRLFLGSQATRGRLAGLLGLGVVAMILGFAVGASDASDEPMLERGAEMIGGFGLAVLVPVATLVFAAASLGDLHEDGTLVYVWLRPISRWRIVAAAAASTLTITLPLTVVPLGIAAALVGAGGELVAAAVAACTIGVVGYTGVFTWLGLRVKRALVWGLAYILIWEGFVATASTNTARLSLRAHTRSLLFRLADGPERHIEVSLATAIAIPLLAAVAGIVLTVRRLRRQDVA